MNEIQIEGILGADSLDLRQFLLGCREDSGKVSELFKGLSRLGLHIFSGGPQGEEELHHLFVRKSLEASLHKSFPQSLPVPFPLFLPVFLVHGDGWVCWRRMFLFRIGKI